MKIKVLIISILTLLPISANAALAYYWGFANQNQTSILTKPDGKVLCQVNKNDKLRFLPIGDNPNWHATDNCGSVGWIHQEKFDYTPNK